MPNANAARSYRLATAAARYTPASPPIPSGIRQRRPQLGRDLDALIMSYRISRIVGGWSEIHGWRG
jgi:hypothetical protein